MTDLHRPQAADIQPDDELDRFSRLVRARRTSMAVDPHRPVPAEVVEQLCQLAQWAPNHKRTWPWQFALVTGDGRSALGHLIADEMARRDDPADKVAKTRTKYTRTPSTLVVGSAPGDSPLRTAENRDAVAAGIQTLLLGATAIGLSTYWGSCAKGANDAVAAWCGFPPGTHITALIYLGWPLGGQPVAPERPAARVTIIDGRDSAAGDRPSTDDLAAPGEARS